jgi:hypothetical protein
MDSNARTMAELLARRAAETYERSLAQRRHGQSVSPPASSADAAGRTLEKSAVGLDAEGRRSEKGSTAVLGLAPRSTGA